MPRGVFQIERLGAGADQRDQSLTALEVQMSDRVFVQAFGGDEQEPVTRGIHQIDGAHLGAHRFAHARNDDVQRMTERRRRIDVLNDAAQRIEHF